MTIPQYKTVRLDPRNANFDVVPEKLDDELNRYAADGWVLHTIMPDSGVIQTAAFIAVLVKK